MDARRDFLKMLAAGAGGCLLGARAEAEPTAAAPPPDFNALFADARGRGCAHRMMVAGLEYLDEPAELDALGALSNGGMGIGGLCGFCSAGVMLIALAAAGQADLAPAMKARKAFLDAWKEKWPVTCPEIKKAQAEETLKATCGEIGTEAAAILAPILAPLAANPARVRFARRPSSA